MEPAKAPTAGISMARTRATATKVRINMVRRSLCGIVFASPPSERAENSPSGIAKLPDGHGDTATDDVASFGGAHLEFFIAVDDRAGLQQNGGHPGRFQHDQLVIAIDTGFLVQQRMLVLAHDRQGKL